MPNRTIAPALLRLELALTVGPEPDDETLTSIFEGIYPGFESPDRATPSQLADAVRLTFGHRGHLLQSYRTPLSNLIGALPVELQVQIGEELAQRPDNLAQVVNAAVGWQWDRHVCAGIVRGLQRRSEALRKTIFELRSATTTSCIASDVAPPMMTVISELVFALSDAAAFIINGDDSLTEQHLSQLLDRDGVPLVDLLAVLLISRGLPSTWNDKIERLVDADGQQAVSDLYGVVLDLDNESSP